MKKPLIEFKYSGLYKVISGGQTGSDQAGLYVARDFGLETGGFIPRGFKTSEGSALHLAQFGLIETQSDQYPDRTKRNAAAGDATIRLASDFSSGGEILTLKLVNQLKKPHFDVLLDGRNCEFKAQALVDFLINHSIGCLNVAGNRDKDCHHGFHFKEASKILSASFEILKSKNLLITQ